MKTSNNTLGKQIQVLAQTAMKPTDRDGNLWVRIGKDYNIALPKQININTGIEISNPNGCDICALGEIAVDGLCVDCAEKHLPGYQPICNCGSVHQVAGGLCEACAIKEGWTINA